jgi:hypothetical protein
LIKRTWPTLLAEAVGRAEVAIGARAKKLETVTLVTLEAAPSVAVVVTAPVVELAETVSKPFWDRTGPDKVVFAMIPHMRARGAVCMSSGRDPG